MSQSCTHWNVPSPEEISATVSKSFETYIGNESAISRLKASAIAAWYNKFHTVSQNFAIVGPPSTGKTTLAKLFAKSIELPFIETDGKSIKGVNQFVEMILSDLQFKGIDIHQYQDKPYNYLLPPCIIFIDEAHALNNGVSTSLLKATERKDAKLIAENGTIVNCVNVCWIIATTERGLIFDALDTRFVKIQLECYNKEQIAQIIKIHHPDLNDETCETVAFYNNTTAREALDFVKEMKIFATPEIHNGGNVNWSNIAKIVAEKRGIDEFGMDHMRLNVLKILSHRPISKSNLPAMARIRIEELNKHILPPLMASSHTRKPMVIITQKGYCLTEDGAKELKKRNIKVENKAIVNES